MRAGHRRARCEPAPLRQHGHDQAGSPAAQVPGKGHAGDGPQTHGRTNDADQRQRIAADVCDDDGQRPFEGAEEQTCRPRVQAEAERSGWRAARRMGGHGPVTVYVMDGIVCRCLFRCGIS